METISKKCIKCKASNKQDYVYCHKCGARSPKMQKLVDSKTKKIK